MMIAPKRFSDSELKEIFSQEYDSSTLCARAFDVRKRVYSNDVYLRGLIEFTNFCRNNCFYCGLRKENDSLSRYRLSKEQILDCCKKGYALGYRTFVLQGGEDLFYDDEKIVDLVSSIKKDFPDCAVTLSIGEKSRESYAKYFDAGCDRFLLRHETADFMHYIKLHPKNQTFEKRKKCLYDLKEIGYQVGSGFMVGSPFQTLDSIIADIRFLEDLEPQMIGIGPFIPHSKTPFGNFPAGNLELTVKLISVLRLEFPNALIPATTAVATLSKDGRVRALKAGANVVMPNLSPVETRKDYSLYDKKASTGSESSEGHKLLEKIIEDCGLKISVCRGDPK